MDSIFSSFTARFLIEALGRGELGGALAAPAGWQRWDIETSPWAKYPSVWQNAKSPRAHTAPAPPSLAFHYHIHSLSESCRCVFILHTQTCIKRTAKILLPVWYVVAVDGGGVEMMLLWPLSLSLSLSLMLFHPLLKLTHTHAMVHFTYSPLLLPWSLSGGKKPFLFFQRFDRGGV